MKLNFPLHPKQWIAFTSKATEILYGGSAGAAKSHLMRVVAIMWCLAIPGLQVYLFRRLYDDLIKNHMEGPTGFHALLSSWLGKYIEIVDSEIRFNNGSRIYLCHCQHEKDRFKYQGAEIHVLLIDELTHFTEIIYRFLRSRVRMPANMNIPVEYQGLFPRILCGTNPGGIGHQFVKATWIDGAVPYEIYATNDNEGGFKRQYIPAKLSDNPSLDQEAYRRNLSGLGNEALVRAMLDGDWDIVAGAALSLSRAAHLVRPFSPPKHWTKFMGMDWGFVKPYAVGWFTVVEGDTLLAAKGDHQDVYLPDKAVVLYRELYGTTGKPNEGSKDESPIVAKKILDMEKTAEDRMDYRVADTQLWSKNDGPSMAERMFAATNGAFNPQKAIKDRQANYAEFCNRLRGYEVDKNTYVPMFYITENCQNFWRTVPPLVLDDLNPEKGPDEGQENHCLAPETLILTKAGPKRLDTLITGDLVLTTNGYRPCIQLGKMNGKQTIYKVVFSDKTFIRMTSDHRLLTDDGSYVECDKLRKGDKLCVLSQTEPSKSLMDCAIGLWENITAAIQKMGAGRGCTESFGSTTMEKSHTVFTYITLTVTGIIIRSKISLLSMVASIFHFICRKKLQPVGGLSTSLLNDLSVSPRQVNGTNQRWAENGIESRQKETARSLQDLNVYASFANRNFFPSNAEQKSVAANALSKNGAMSILSITEESEKIEVWNLHVPGPNNYILANGVVSHNCYDMVAYSLMSRPFITTQVQRAERLFKQGRKHLRETTDPYRLNPMKVKAR